MNMLSRLLVVACLALPFTACKKDEAPQTEAVAAVPLPTSSEQKDWKPYLEYKLTPHMDGITNSPYVYFLPGETSEGFGGQYQRLLEKVEGDLGRGIIEGNMLVFASPSSAKIGELAVVAFGQVPAGSLNNVKVVFIGKPEDSMKVEAASKPAGVKYVFVQTQ